MSNKENFAIQLAVEYERLFKINPNYAYAASKTTPEALAVKMTNSLIAGTGNKDGEGIKNTCKFFNIPYTYKAIKEFLNVNI